MPELYGPAAGEWQPLHPREAVLLVNALRVPWWIAGGWALDLFLGTQSRAHKDLDVGILRRDVSEALSALPGWEFFEARDNRLLRLHSGELPRANVHSLWGRPAGATRWFLEILLDESEGDRWIFRRQRQITLPLGAVIRHSSKNIPYLAPEIQLLYKARGIRQEDQADFERVAPRLDASALAWLRHGLRIVHPDHPWVSLLDHGGG